MPSAPLIEHVIVTRWQIWCGCFLEFVIWFNYLNQQSQWLDGPFWSGLNVAHRFTLKLNKLDPCTPKTFFFPSVTSKWLMQRVCCFATSHQNICSSDLCTWDWVFIITVEWVQCRTPTGFTTAGKKLMHSASTHVENILVCFIKGKLRRQTKHKDGPCGGGGALINCVLSLPLGPWRAFPTSKKSGQGLYEDLFNEPTRSLYCLKCLISSLVFTFVTMLPHYVTLCIMHAIGQSSNRDSTPCWKKNC